MGNAKHATARPIVLQRPCKPQQGFYTVKIVSNFRPASHDALRINHRLASYESRKNHLGNPLSQFIFGSVLGGADRLSELEHQVVRRAVGLALRCEQIETQLAEGKPVDIAATATLINVFNRTASLLGLKRRARDVTPHLEDYISQRYSADDGGL